MKFTATVLILLLSITKQMPAQEKIICAGKIIADTSSLPNVLNKNLTPILKSKNQIELNQNQLL